MDKITLDITDHYTKDLNEEDIKQRIKNTVDILINEYKKTLIDDINTKFYILGSIYEKIIPYYERKQYGEVYTQKSIVDYIMSSIGYTIENDIENKKIIDISCGAGNFLVEALHRLIEKYCLKYNVLDMNDLDTELLKNIIIKIKNSIYGIDINPIACILCQITIYLVLFKFYNRIIVKEGNYSLPLFNIENKSSLEFLHMNKYDYVVGNPPYLFIRDIPENQRLFIENQDFETNIGQYDYYQIFIEIGIKILKEKGELGYIVPDSLLALSNRKIIREFIKRKTCIKELFYLGPSFKNSVVSNIIIILQKEKDKKLRENNEIKIKIGTFKTKKVKKVFQAQLDEWDNKFLIHLDNYDITILKYLNHNFPKIKHLFGDNRFVVKLNRGVELSKEGLVFNCIECNKYYPLPKKKRKCNTCGASIKLAQIEKIIQDHPSKEELKDYMPFIYSINRYSITKYKYINRKKDGIQYKNIDNYINRIIIRQISQSNLICATYVENLFLCSQSFYNLKIKDSSIIEFNNHYLLGLINSHLLSFYFLKSFGSYKKLFPRILIEKIRYLPIKIPEDQNERVKALKIKNNVIKILKMNDNNGKEEKEKIQKEIDYDIYDLYSIENNYREYIENFFE
ncbi:MAG: Eco57I restriction-modification methylase domain-containing protein [Candidatus Lokiarchaeota archaeon]|nr:Eco57I restriction-modification methylase domain-containing protein [Candidatus Lokiarchaeota archaeon]